MNKVILTGNIVRDIELRYTPSGKAVCDVSIANNDNSENTVFVACVAWDKTAEFLSKYFCKGKAILIEGWISQDTWVDTETGKNRSKTKVTITRVEFQGKKEDSPQSQQPQAPFGSQQAIAQSQVQQPVAQPQAPQQQFTQPQPVAQPQHAPQVPQVAQQPQMDMSNQTPF